MQLNQFELLKIHDKIYLGNGKNSYFTMHKEPLSHQKLLSYQELLSPIHHFLKCATPDEWLEEARKPDNLSTILYDHLLCELKASQSAMFLLKRYVVNDEGKKSLTDLMQPFEDFAYRGIGSLNSLKNKNALTKRIETKPNCLYGQEMIDKLVLLIKEELHHFYQVLEIIEAKGLKYRSIPAGRYAKNLAREVRTFEPAALIDKLIIGAFIEARSCERFAKLAPFLEAPIQKFYISLLRSEARHYQDYLALAEQIAGKNINERIEHFAKVEADLILMPDTDFKFHSGNPIINELA